SQLIELNPKDWRRWADRGLLHALLGQWDKAAADTGKAIDLWRTDDILWMRHAVFLLRVGDIKGYRQACKEMIERFGQTKHPIVAHRVAWTCLLLPDAVSDQKLLMTLAKRSVDGAPGNPWCRITLGIALYRADRFEQAVKKLQPIAELEDFELVTSLLL